MKRILYVQHAGALGGSCVSMMYMLRTLDRSRFEPVVALARPTREVAQFYEQAGFETLAWPLPLFDHSTTAPRPLYSPATWRMLADVMRHGPGGGGATLRLVDATRADLVHLNGSPLAISALALSRAHVPLVWHVRDYPWPDRGARYMVLRALMRRVPSMVFISDADRDAWVGPDHGTVVANFVDIEKFSRPSQDGPSAAELGLTPGDDVVLYVGGIATVKGVFPLLKALALARSRRPRLKCLMPGALVRPSGRWQSNLARAVLPLVGSGTELQRVEKTIDRLGLEDVCLRLPFSGNMQRLLELSDVLVFPAVEPHFARPAIEAAAAGRPSIVSQLPGLAELVIDGETGLHVPARDPAALAAALVDLLGDPTRRGRMGENARAMASRRFDARVQMATIMGLYDRELSGR